MKKCYVALGAFLLLTACSSKVDFETMSAEEIYNYAMDEMEKTRYSKAETAFETLETDHPYSQWAVRSKLMSAYAYYKDEKYDDAVMAVDRFIKYHPGNKDVPYALYLKGMCYYDQISSADKDQGNTQKAAETFALLMAMYPDSEYAKDAAGKMNLTEDYKAGQEMIIGRYYLHEGNYLSALNRFNVVLENYQKTIQIEEALYRQVEIYAIFGLNNYANGYFKILQQNYPEGKWTAKAEKIMKKIGVEVQPSKAKTKAEKTENTAEAVAAKSEKASEAVKETVQETVQETAQETKEESKGWFSGWFGGSDDKTEEVKAEAENTAEAVAVKSEKASEAVKETVQETAQETKEESKGWFSGWFGGSDDKTEEVKAQTASENQVTEVTDAIKEVSDLAKKDAQTAKSKSDSFGSWGGNSQDKAEDLKIYAEESKPAVAENEVAKISESVAEAEEIAEPVKEQLPEAQEESKGWFSGWFGGSDDKAEEVTETVEETIPEAQEESKGWFSGWFGGSEISEDMAQSKKAANDAINETLDGASDDAAEALDATEDVVEETSENVHENVEKAEQKSSWFSGLFSGGTLMGDDAAE